MKSSTETSILSVLFGGIVESAFEENVLHNNAFSLSRCNRVFLGFEESIDRSKIMCVCVCAWKRERRVSCEEGSVFSKNVKKARFSRFRVCVVVQALGFMSASVLLPYITSLLRKINRVGEDSRCRGGIVHTRFGCSRALLVRPLRPTALWRFRASTSNSPSSRTWPHTNTHLRYIHHTYAQQGIRVCGDDQF